MTAMEEFNASPFTRTTSFRVPQKQAEDLEKQIQAVLNQTPLLKEVVKHLDEKIAATDSVKKALELSAKYEVTKEQALIILDIVNQQLAGERSYILARVERAKR